MAKDSENATRSSGGAYDAEGKWVHRVNLPVATKTTTDLFDGRKRVVPVLFIPGIMGSVLKTSGIKHKMAWNPPSNLIQGGFTLVEYIFMGANERAEVLDPGKTEVFRASSGPVLADARTGSVSQALRGWESVWRAGYWPMMEYIEVKLNSQSMPEGLDNPPFEYGMMGNGAPLTEEDFNKVLCRYRYEVWGGGYNWLQSNARSADELWHYVEETILNAYPDDILNEEGKILVVTHSMGGFVARALCAEGSRCERILGVVHTVMPALGAPATYKRMRAGFEGLSSPVLGYNAAQVTSVMAAAQGGLELLPFSSYNGGSPWLYYPKEINQPGELQPLPTGNPYDSIYKSNKWYGIVPYYHEHMLGNDSADETVRDAFNSLIDEVETFHRKILDAYHPKTVAIWGAFEKMKTWGKVVWEQKKRPRDPMSKRGDHLFDPLLRRNDKHNDNKLGQVTQGNYMVDIQGPDCPGDGTVPDISAAGQAQGAMLGCFIHSRNTPKNGNEDYEHSLCFDHQMMKWSVVYSVARIVVEAFGKKLC